MVKEVIVYKKIRIIRIIENMNLKIIVNNKINNNINITNINPIIITINTITIIISMIDKNKTNNIISIGNNHMNINYKECRKY